MSLYKHLHFRGNGSLVATHIIKSLHVPCISVAKNFVRCIQRSLNRNSEYSLRVCCELTEKLTNRTLIKYGDFLVSFNKSPEHAI